MENEECLYIILFRQEVWSMHTRRDKDYNQLIYFRIQTEIFEMLHKQTKTVCEIAYMQANALIVCRSQFNISFEKM